MRTFFELLLHMTLTTSVTILMIFSVKIVLNQKLSPRFSATLWLLLLVRVLFPILPQSPTSIFNTIALRELSGIFTYVPSEEIRESPSGQMTTVFPDASVKMNVLSHADSTISAADDSTLPRMFPEDNETASVNRRLPYGEIPLYDAVYSIADLLISFYLFGIAATASFTILSYYDRKKHVLETASFCDAEPFLSIYGKIAEEAGVSEKSRPMLSVGDSSVLLGIFHPIIVVNRRSSLPEAEMILSHELHHFRHRDNLLLAGFHLLCCVFWFNPLIWIAASRFRLDLEVLCDYKTLEKNKIKKEDYAMFLFKSTDKNRQSSISSALSSAGRVLKTRISAIACIKRGKYVPKLLCVVMVVAMAALCLTNPIMSDNGDYKIYIENFIAMTGYDAELPKSDASVTAEQFYGMLLVALNSIEMNEDARATFSVLGDGTFASLLDAVKTYYPYDEELQAFFNEILTPETILTREKAAFILDTVMHLRSMEMQTLPASFGGDSFQTLLSSLNADEKALFESHYSMVNLLGDNVPATLRDEQDAAETLLASDRLLEMAQLFDTREALDAYILEVSVRYVCDDDVTSADKLAMYEILSVSATETAALPRRIDITDIYHSGYIAQIDVAAFEDDILPFVDSADDIAFLNSVYQYDNEGFYQNESVAAATDVESHTARINRVYAILTAALNRNPGGKLRQTLSSAENTAAIPLIGRLPQSVYEKCLSALADSDRIRFQAIYRRGVTGISQEALATYPEEEYNKINEAIDDVWTREKFASLYRFIDNATDDPDNFLAEFGIDLRATETAYDDTARYYVRDPYTTEREQRQLNLILATYIPGDSAEMYYLNKSLLSALPEKYEELQSLYQKCGITSDIACDINACTGYRYPTAVTEYEAKAFYPADEYELLLASIPDKSEQKKFQSFYTEKNIAVNSVLETVGLRSAGYDSYLAFLEMDFPGITAACEADATSNYFLRDPYTVDREQNQLNQILTAALNGVTWQNILPEARFTDDVKATSYLFREAAHRVHLTGIMTDAGDQKFGYTQNLTFGEAAKITCRFLTGTAVLPCALTMYSYYLPETN